MKTWALGAVAVSISVVGLVACGGSSSSGSTGTKGAGGSSSGKTTSSTVASTGTTVSSTAASTGPTSGAGGAGGGTSGGSCTAPSTIQDCGGCSNQGDCINCASMVDQAGVQDYNDVLNCIFCNSCYTTCDGATAGCATDAGAPVEDTTCDTGAASMSTCMACQSCALKAGGSCNAALTACEGVMQCVDLAQNLNTVCGGLPM